MNKFVAAIALGLLSLSHAFVAGQTLVGAATVYSAGCYQITPAQNSVNGAVWFPGPVDITSSFEMRADVFLGASNGGADGMAFVLRPVGSLSLGSTPGGANQGFGGITPSLIVEMDTYTNTLNPAWDPVSPADHLAVLSNGSPSHQASTALAGPVAAIAPNGNIEDNAYHELRVVWDENTELLEIYFDCELRLDVVVDIETLLGSNEALYGFTASTGGLNNAHRACDVEWNPVNPSVLPEDVTLCVGSNITWTLPAGSTNISWSPMENGSLAGGTSLTITAEASTTMEIAWENACGIAFSEEVVVSVIDGTDVFESISVCPNEPLILDPVGGATATITWSDGTVSPTWTVTEPGTYEAAVATPGCNYVWTADVAVSPTYEVDLGPDVVLCFEALMDLDAIDENWTGPDPTFLWDDGSPAATRSDLGPGNYAVEVTTDQCTFSDEIVLTASPNQGVDLGQDVSLCWYEGLSWNSGYAAAETEWYALESSGTLMLGSGESWEVDGTANADWQGLVALVTIGECITSDTVALEFVSAYNPNLPASVTFCDGESYVLEASSGADTYLWGGGPALPEWQVSSTVNAQLTATVEGCVVVETVEVVVEDLPAVDCGPNVQVCEGTEVVLNAGVFNADSFSWEGPAGSGQGVTFDAVVSGTYSVTVTDGNCTASDEVDVFIQPIPYFELGENVLGCPGVSEQLIAEGLPVEATLEWGHGPNATSVQVFNSGVYTAVSEWNGCFFFDAVQVTFAEPLLLDLPASVKKCPEDTVHLNVEQPLDIFPVSYEWSDGSIAPSVSFVQHGDYSVVVSNECQTLQAAIEIELESCDCALFVPTGFTPDQDGVNDAFRPVFNCPVASYRLTIFNRWGDAVFTSDDPGAWWYGQVTNEVFDAEPYYPNNGLYFWQIELNYFVKGEPHAEMHAGNVLIVR